MEKFGTVEVAVEVKHELVLGTTPDGLPEVWLLYSPEPFAFDSDDNRAIHLWMRRCSVFTSRDAATAHLAALLGHPVAFEPYDALFPELWIYRERRSGAMQHRWLMCPAPVDPFPGGKL